MTRARAGRPFAGAVRRAGAALCLVLAGCELFPPEEQPTLLSHLTLLAVKQDPSEARPGRDMGFEVWVADPIGGPLDVMVWSCTPDAGSCVEASVVPLPISGLTRVVRASTDLPVRVEIPLPEAVAAFIPEGGRASTLGWALACRPGLCGVMDRVEADPEPGSAAWAAVLGELADPLSTVEGLDIDDAALGLKRLLLTDPRTLYIPPGPAVARAGRQPLVVPAGGTMLLDVLATDAVNAWPYTMAGSWGATRYDITRGRATQTWYAPDEPGMVRVFTVVDDAEGHVDVWSEEVEVR